MVPRGIAPGYQYAGFAIAMAFALWGIERQCPGVVRAAVSPWKLVGVSQAGRWRALKRWVQAVRDGRLFPGLILTDSAVRALAEHVANIAIGHSPPADRRASLVQRAWQGGAVMA